MKNITIRIPEALRSFTGGKAEIPARGATVGAVFDALRGDQEALHGRIMTGDGKVHKFVKVYLDGRSVSSRQGLDTPLREGDVLLLVQAMVGG